MDGPCNAEVSLKDTIQLLEHYATFALGYARDMERYDSIWHPSADHNVQRPLTDTVKHCLEMVLMEAKVIRRMSKMEDDSCASTQGEQ